MDKKKEETPAMEEFLQLKHSEIATYRARLLKEQGNVCAICKLECAKFVLDHQHKRRRSDPNGVNGDGCVRGVLCDGCNRIEVSVFGFDFVLFACIVTSLTSARDLFCRAKSGTTPIDSASTTCSLNS